MTSRLKNGSSPTVEPAGQGGYAWESTQGWRERAQAALTEKKSATTAERIKNRTKLTALMQEIVGVNIADLSVEEPGDTIILDGVTFRVLQYDAPTGDQLVILRPCGRCGKATSSALLKTLLGVAEALEEWDPQCRDCQHRATQPNAPTGASGAAGPEGSAAGSQ